MSESRFRVGEDEIEYDVRYSDDASRRRIDVGMHGVTVVLPAGDDTDPENLLEENHEWVVEKIAKYDAYREQAPDREFIKGATFPYLIEPLEQGGETYVRCEYCGAELLTKLGGIEGLMHVPDCERPRAGE